MSLEFRIADIKVDIEICREKSHFKYSQYCRFPRFYLYNLFESLLQDPDPVPIRVVHVMRYLIDNKNQIDDQQDMYFIWRELTKIGREQKNPLFWDLYYRFQL
jgi:hypothetical protein